MKVYQDVHHPYYTPKCDWFAWLETDDDIYIKVQIGYQATEQRAKAIILSMINSKEEMTCPKP